jgi:hypothetical protein
MKRVTWFVAGAAAGVSATRLAKKKAQAVAEKLAPDHIARQAVATAKDKALHVVDAVREGKDTMRTKEAELRARRDGHPMAAGMEQLDPRVIDTTVVGRGRLGRRGDAVHHLDDWRKRKAR